ncbi:MAG: hypothetical protein JWO87_1398 [Phycisphaerales bacterium]|nr:hypothetical protein [Phycisphaerales bacterium]
MKDRVEALGWLTGAPPNIYRNVGEMTHNQAVALVRRLYKWGVPEVIAVNIGASPDGSIESTDDLIAVLPSDLVARKRVITWNNKRSYKMGYEAPTEDHGQSHLLVWFD